MAVTIIFIDAFDNWPVLEVGRRSGAPWSPQHLDGDDVPPWAVGTLVYPRTMSYGWFSVPASDDWNDRTGFVYLVRDYTGQVRQLFGVEDDGSVAASYNRNAPALLRCSDCPNRWTVGSRDNGEAATRPLYRTCCARFVCSECHFDSPANLWDCHSCDSEHCSNIEMFTCDEDGVDTCMENHCRDDEYDPDYSDSRYRSRSVNTELRLHGPSHEKARGARYVGVEIEAEDGEGYNLHTEIPAGCGITSDGSLSNGVEIQTPPARGSKFVEIIEKTTDALKSAGWDTSARCGLHVHVDMTDRTDDGEFLGRLYAAFFAIEPLLFALQGGRRDNNGYCMPLKEAYGKRGSLMRGKSAKKIMAEWHHVRRFRQESPREFDMRLESMMRDKYHQSRYRATNFHSIGCHGTLEIRLHEGTLDADTILAWTDMIQSIIRACEDDRWPGGQRLRYAADPVKAQRMFRFTRKTREYMVKRLNQEATNLSGKRYAVTAGAIAEIGEWV